MRTDAGFEALQGCEIHILRISCGGTVYYIIIGKGLVKMFVDGSRPDAIAVTLHGDGFAENLPSEFYFLRLWCLHAEDDTIAQILW